MSGTLTLLSPLSPDESIVRLEQRFALNLSRMTSRPFRGAILVDEVRVWRNHWRQSFFQPEFCGILIANGGGAQLTGGFRPMRGTTAIYYVLLVVMPLLALTMGVTHSGGLNGTGEGLVTAAMCVPTVWAMGWLGRAMTRDDPAAIEAFLRETLAAR